MKRKTRILFIRLFNSPFIQKDLDLLRKSYDVGVVDFTWTRSNLKGSLVTLFKMLRGILWADLTFSWFADFHAAYAVRLSKIFRKKSIVVVGGYEVGCEPEINYGVMRFPESKQARTVKYVLKHASKILPFSDFAADEVLHICPASHMEAIPLACDTEKFKAGADKKNIVLTVCLVTRENIARKGLKTFIESAHQLSETKFILVGPHVDGAAKILRNIASPNVEFTGFAPEGELIEWYQRAKVYCQLSYQEGEGAGGALGEAMASECVPVVSTKAITLKETVGECGHYVPYGDTHATVKAIREALSNSNGLGQKARKRMVENFSMEKRKANLSRVIEEVLDNNREKI